MGRLDGRVVLITGAARGQGRQFALAAAREGAAVVLVGRSEVQAREADRLAAVAAEVEAQGARALQVRADVTRADELERAVARALEMFGRIDVVVPNAGILSFGSTWELAEDAWDAMLDVNLKGVWLTCKAAIPTLIEQRGGKIVCVSSIYGLHGSRHGAHYAAAKHGVVGLVRTMALELAPFEINVNAICPTALDTEMSNAQEVYDLLCGRPGGTREEALRAFEDRHLLPDASFLPADACVGAFLFLASDDSRYVTGTVIPVDAGYLTS